MTRTILAFAIVLAVVAPARVQAQPAPAAGAPTPAQLEKAKKAFGEGKKAFEAGDFPEAISKFKESYSLSKNPVLLYNIAFANESAGMDDIALFYYRKFLTDAPQDAGQRSEVNDRVKALEKKFQTGPTPAGGSTPAEQPRPDEPKKPIVIKPPGTYSATDFQTQIVESAPPAKPLDVTASVPEDSGWVVTLFFRTAGEGKWDSKVMKWRYKELVGRIPPRKMIGSSVQYYIEAKDATGAVIARSGKSISPNLVNLEAGTPPKFYPDFDEEGNVQTAAETRRQDDEEDDPLNAGKKKRRVATKQVDPDSIDVQPGPVTPANGFSDVGSSKFKYAKWGTTGGAAVLVGLSVWFYVQAGSYARALQDETSRCGTPPCEAFDSYNAGLESTGKSYQDLSHYALGVGIAATAVAGYFWYKELTAKKRGELKVSGKTPAPETSWVVVPNLGDQFAGASAATRF